jgi:hypothetical protein
MVAVPVRAEDWPVTADLLRAGYEFEGGQPAMS